MPLGEARDNNLAPVAWQLATVKIAGDAADVRHADKVINEVQVVRGPLADRFEVVGHAGRAVDDADILGAAVLAGRLVDDMPDLGEGRRLKAVANDRLEGRGQDERGLALQDLSGGKCLLRFRHVLRLLVAGVEDEASVQTGPPGRGPRQ